MHFSLNSSYRFFITQDLHIFICFIYDVEFSLVKFKMEKKIKLKRRKKNKYFFFTWSAINAIRISSCVILSCGILSTNLPAKFNMSAAMYSITATKNSTTELSSLYWRTSCFNKEKIERERKRERNTMKTRTSNNKNRNVNWNSSDMCHFGISRVIFN